eukprot:6027889-Prorocentrum_lima.AAC.1
MSTAWHWELEPPEGKLAGHIFTDGAASGQEEPALARAGWGLAAFSSDGKLTGSAYGHVPWQICPSQTPKDGEDYAYFMAAEL